MGVGVNKARENDLAADIDNLNGWDLNILGAADGLNLTALDYHDPILNLWAVNRVDGGTLKDLSGDVFHLFHLPLVGYFTINDGVISKGDVVQRIARPDHNVGVLAHLK